MRHLEEVIQVGVGCGQLRQLEALWVHSDVRAEHRACARAAHHRARCWARLLVAVGERDGGGQPAAENRGADDDPAKLHEVSLLVVMVRLRVTVATAPTPARPG